MTHAGKFIPTAGSTINVLVDGVAIGQVDYNHSRPDIATLFPGLANSDGAIGFRVLDTTTLTNTLHTISWTVSDSAGAVEGIGSRFFAVSNGVSAVTAAPGVDRSVGAAARVATAPLEERPIRGRRGWDLDRDWEVYPRPAQVGP